MRTKRKTMIVTGAAKGIGAGVTNAFIERGYNVFANSLNITASTFAPSERLAVVEGDIGDPSTAQEIASTALKSFGSIDGVVNNAGIFFTKPFTEYTAEDFDNLSGVNLRGYVNITQLAVKQITAMVEHPIAGVNASLPMVTKGGLEAIAAEVPDIVLSVTRALAEDDLESSYARLPSVDFSRDILANQAKRLLVLRDSGSGWADLGSPDRVLGLLAKDVNQPAWARQADRSS